MRTCSTPCWRDRSSVPFLQNAMTGRSFERGSLRLNWRCPDVQHCVSAPYSCRQAFVPDVVRLIGSPCGSSRDLRVMRPIHGPEAGFPSPGGRSAHVTDYSSSNSAFRRNVLGATPVCWVKKRVKCAGWLNPSSSEISARDAADLVSSVVAQLTLLESM